MFDITDIGYWVMVLGGLGLFLFGINSISKVLKRMASKKLETAITKCSSNRFLGFLTGAGFTAVIQSSSGTSALAIGLVRAGMMTLVQASAILIGANIGTTITAFIVSIPLAEYLALLLFVGSIILMLVSSRKWTNVGELFFALGSIFLGLFVMGTYLKTLSTQDWFINILEFLSTAPWLGLLLGAVLTALLQSSSAVVGVMQGIYAASGGVISLFGILPIVFGSNIGTTSTAMIASIGGSKESKRVALFHCIFNVVGALLFMGVSYMFQSPLTSINAESGLSAEMQVALCHLIFNATTAIIFFPLLNLICKLLEKVIKDKGDKKPAIILKDLDKSFLREFPTQGIALAKEQVNTIFGYSKLMFETMNLYLDNHKKDDADFIVEIEAAIDRTDRYLNDYLLSVEKGDLTESDLKNLTITLKGCKDIERIGDYAENLLTFFTNIYERKNTVTEEYLNVLKLANTRASSIIEETIEVFKKQDTALALKVIQDRRDYIADLSAYENKHFDNVSKKKGTEASYLDLVFVDIINCYERVYSHCSNIAKLFNTDKVYDYSLDEQKRFETMKDRY